MISCGLNSKRMWLSVFHRPYCNIQIGLCAFWPTFGHGPQSYTLGSVEIPYIPYILLQWQWPCLTFDLPSVGVRIHLYELTCISGYQNVNWFWAFLGTWFSSCTLDWRLQMASGCEWLDCVLHIPESPPMSAETTPHDANSEKLVVHRKWKVVFPKHSSSDWDWQQLTLDVAALQNYGWPTNEEEVLNCYETWQHKL